MARRVVYATVIDSAISGGVRVSTQPSDRIDVDALLASVDIAEVVGRYVELKRAGKELAGLCPFHSERTASFHVVPQKQAAFCNGCGWHGDAIDFVARIESVDFREACSRLGARDATATRVERKPLPERPPERITRKPPADAGEPVFRTRRHGEPTRVWTYRDAGGDVLGYVARYEYTDDGRQKKQTPQWTWGSSDSGHTWSWGMGHWNQPRPLYGLDRLAARSEAEVLIPEGEKACDAAAILGAYVNVSWPGGCQAIKHVDWSPLAGRRVILWPDADEPGIAAMGKLAAVLHKLGCTVRIIEPTGQTDGWDIADAVEAGWNVARLRDWARERIRVWQPPSSVAEAAPAASAPPDAPVAAKPPRPALSLVDGTAVRKPKPIVDDLPPEYSDDAVAAQFTAKHGQTLRYVHPWARWFAWTGQRWLQDDTLESLDLARAVCREAAAQAFADRNLTPAQQRRGAQSLASARTRAAIEGMARADRAHSATTDLWDADPWALNTPLGVVNLQTGQLRPARADDYQTKITKAAPGGECPRWMEFLGQVTAGDVELQGFLRRVAGYSLTGTTREHALFFIYGTGRNGKGVFLNTLHWILGDYSHVASVDTFTDSKDGRHPTELAELRGARLVTAQETEEGRRWAESKLKALTGGDPITARFMRQDNFTFDPQFKLVIAGNHKPGLRNVDEAIRARLNLIPFTVTIPVEQRDPKLQEKLRTEAGGILQWMVDGCLEWQRDGLRPPDSVRASTDEYVESQDTIGSWISEACVIGDYERSGSTQLYTSFAAWAEERREYVPTQTRFAEKLAARGLVKARNGRGAMEYVGIGIPLGSNARRPGPMFND